MNRSLRYFVLLGFLTFSLLGESTPVNVSTRSYESLIQERDSEFVTKSLYRIYIKHGANDKFNYHLKGVAKHESLLKNLVSDFICIIADNISGSIWGLTRACIDLYAKAQEENQEYPIRISFRHNFEDPQQDEYLINCSENMPLQDFVETVMTDMSKRFKFDLEVVKKISKKYLIEYCHLNPVKPYTGNLTTSQW